MYKICFFLHAIFLFLFFFFIIKMEELKEIYSKLDIPQDSEGFTRRCDLRVQACPLFPSLLLTCLGPRKDASYLLDKFVLLV